MRCSHLVALGFLVVLLFGSLSISIYSTVILDRLPSCLAFCPNGTTPSIVIDAITNTTSCDQSPQIVTTRNGTGVIYSFSIPSGCAGEPGVNGTCLSECINGDNGVTIVTAETTIGPNVTTDVIVSNTSQYNIHVTIGVNGTYENNPGPEGPQGNNGSAATIVVASTLFTAPNTEAMVTNSGSDSAVVLHFAIPSGNDGTNGTTIEVVVGEVITSEPGTNATVTVVAGGDNLNTLNFGIPRGDMGMPGVNGSSASVFIGSTTTREAGSGANVTSVVTGLVATFNFTIPRGEMGVNNTPNATVVVANTTTGAPGTNATVLNVGTPTNMLLEFTIPQGDQGPTGETGPNGVDGLDATITVHINSNTNLTNVTEPVYNTTLVEIVINITDNATFISSPGPQGPMGIPGTNGTSALASVGNTTTTAVGSFATVVNAGTTSNAILNFTIPTGETGLNGSVTSIHIGNTTTVASTSAPNVVNAGTSNAAVLNFTIPRGSTGIDGTNGTNGMNAPNTTVSIRIVDSSNGTTNATGFTIYNVSADDIYINITENATFVSAPGPQGTAGIDGTNGTAPTIVIGLTASAIPNAEASVVNTGTSTALVLNITIPRGQDGANGTAPTVTAGSTTTTAAGSSATVVNTGTSNALILNFTIPQGAAGTNGTNGVPATVVAGNTSNTAPGTSATVVNAGTSSAAVLNFTIPQGATGTAGTNGTNGANGVPASVSVASPTTYGAPSSAASVTMTGTSSAPVFHFAAPTMSTDCGQVEANIANTASILSGSWSVVFYALFSSGTLSGFTYAAVAGNTSLTYTGAFTTIVYVRYDLTFLANPNVTFYLSIYRNGAELSATQTLTSGLTNIRQSVSFGTVLMASPGDYFQVYSFGTSASTLTIEGGSMTAFVV